MLPLIFLEEIQLTGKVNNSKKKYATIKDYMQGPTLIQRSDAVEIEVVDEDRVQNNHVSAQQDVWLGVWCPTLQNIFGIILFIRFPSLTGSLNNRNHHKIFFRRAWAWIDARLYNFECLQHFFHHSKCECDCD